MPPPRARAPESRGARNLQNLEGQPAIAADRLRKSSRAGRVKMPVQLPHAARMAARGSPAARGFGHDDDVPASNQTCYRQRSGRYARAHTGISSQINSAPWAWQSSWASLEEIFPDFDNPALAWITSSSTRGDSGVKLSRRCTASFGGRSGLPAPGLERLAILLGPRRRKRAQGAPVERVLQGQDFVPLGGLKAGGRAAHRHAPASLPFDRFRSGAREERAIQAGEAGQLLRQRA